MTCLEHLSWCEVEFLDLKVSSEAKWIVLLASWPSTGPSLIPTPPYRAAALRLAHFSTLTRVSGHHPSHCLDLAG